MCAGSPDAGIVAFWIWGVSVPAVCCLAGGGCARCNRAVKGAERRSAPLTARGRLAWSVIETTGRDTLPVLLEPLRRTSHYLVVFDAVLRF